MLRPLSVVLLVVAATGWASVRDSALAASTLDRPLDPVVLTGADVPSLEGAAPDELVAFRYDGGWSDVPVQVDERAVKDLGLVYHQPASSVTVLVYTDAGTFTGFDPDGALDSDDEIVFMAKDTGGRPPSFAEPLGVVPNSGVEVVVSDPLSPGSTGYVYLFRSDGTLTPDAGEQYVEYAFNLQSGSYVDTYNTQQGPNPEDSILTTPYYARHFSDRWVSDEIRITANDATGVDILDRHKNLFSPGECTRSEDTFSEGEGAFVVNKSGPVRAIRSYIGANSGPWSQRDHLFYEAREDIQNELRVHPILGIMDFFDYSPEASGMTYYNDLNTEGVTIDGNPDPVATGPITWELATGAQGSLFTANVVSTSFPGFPRGSYYLDDSSPSVIQCTGDAFAYGSSGLWFDHVIPCTDPGLGCTDTFGGVRTLYYQAPGLTPADASELYRQATTPLSVATSPYAEPVPSPAPTVQALPASGTGFSDTQQPPLWLVLTATGLATLTLGSWLRRGRTR